jgi:protein TonB
MTKFTPPEIVKDEEVKKEDIPPDVDKLEETKIDVINQEGIKSSDIAVPVVDEGKSVVVVKDETNYDQTFTKVEVEADFPGGMGAWRKFLERNLSADVATSAGAPAGSYTVVVQFIVDKEGAVSEVKAQTSHGYGMEEEAVRVIKRSGKWTPAIQNGRQVKAYRKQPVTFMVTEE